MYILGIDPLQTITLIDRTTGGGAELGHNLGLGNLGLNADGKMYIWCEAATGVNQYDAVDVAAGVSPGTYLATPIVAAANTFGKFAIAPITVITGTYFWAQCRGIGVVNVVGATASLTALSWTTTAGRLADLTTERVNGITSLTSTALTTTGTVQVFMSVEPFVAL